MNTVKLCYITLYDSNGTVQSSGHVKVGRHVSLGPWVFGGSHVVRRPLGLIRRIARNWDKDGGYRDYQGQDDTTSIGFTVRPGR